MNVAKAKITSILRKVVNFEEGCDLPGGKLKKTF